MRTLLQLTRCMSVVMYLTAFTKSRGINWVAQPMAAQAKNSTKKGGEKKDVQRLNGSLGVERILFQFSSLAPLIKNVNLYSWCSLCLIFYPSLNKQIIIIIVVWLDQGLQAHAHATRPLLSQYMFFRIHIYIYIYTLPCKRDVYAKLGEKHKKLRDF